MQRIGVGMPLIPGVLAFQEGVHYNYTVQGHTLTIARIEPSQSRIRAVQRGQALFAVTQRENAIFMLSRFGDLEWTATPYNWWINAPVMRPDPWRDMEQLKEGLSTVVCLVNAGNGLVAALRTVTLSLELSCLLIQMVQEQMQPPFDPWRYLEVAEQAFLGNPDPKTLLKNAGCICVANLSAWRPFVGLSHATIH